MKQFNPYSAGRKRYGSGLRDAPNVGMKLDKIGYRERTLRRQAAIRRLRQKNG